MAVIFFLFSFNAIESLQSKEKKNSCVKTQVQKNSYKGLYLRLHAL